MMKTDRMEIEQAASKRPTKERMVKGHQAVKVLLKGYLCSLHLDLEAHTSS